MSWRSDLIYKVEVLKHEYKEILQQEIFTEVTLNPDEMDLFSSMKRWHTNMHAHDKDLIRHLSEVNIRGLLDVKEKMVDIPKELKSYLCAKLKKTHPKLRFCIHDLFENIYDKVKEIYDDKLSIRDSQDGFDIVNIVSGIPTGDINFYTKVFTPAAVFYTYSELQRLNFTKINDLFEDCFSIGAGSKTLDLIPEVTVLCSECGDSRSQLQIEKTNLVIFKCQQKHNFRSKIDYTKLTNTGNESVEKDLHATKVDLASPAAVKLKCVPSLMNDQVNPPSSDLLDEATEESSSYVPPLNRYDTGYRCFLCDKSFSRQDFAGFHNLLYHKEGNNESFVKSSSLSEEGFNPFCSETNPMEISDKWADLNDYIEAEGEIGVFQSDKDLDNQSSVRSSILNDLHPFRCSDCEKSFSEMVFVDFHKLLYHKERRNKRKVVAPKFVDEGLDLMKTFCAETSADDVETIKTPEVKDLTVQPNQNIKRVRKVLRYPN